MPTQILANALISAAGYTLVGLGFGLIYSTARFFHFSHGALYTIGAYVAFSAVNAGAHWSAGVGLAIGACGLLGWLLHRGVYWPLQRRGVSDTGLLVASLGLFVVLQNLVSITYGDEMHAIPLTGFRGAFEVGGARFTLIQLVNVLVSVAICAALWGLLRFSRLGLVLRAAASSAELCRVSGISLECVVGRSFLIGSAMAGAAGALLALDTNLFPTMGFRMLLMAVTAVIVGGLGSMPGTAFAAILVATAQQIGGWYISAEWQDAIAFALLLVFLVWRPQGFFGKPLRKVTV